MHKWISSLFLLAMMAAAQRVTSQTRSTEVSPESTFRAGTRLVEVDVVAKRSGASATGLSKEDFKVLDNGKPQPISFFFIKSTRTREPDLAPLSPGAVSNRLARDGEAFVNATVLLIDQKNTPRAVQTSALPRVAKYIERRRHRDRVGIYALLGDGSIRVIQELTDNPVILNRAAKTLKSRDPSLWTTDSGGLPEHAPSIGIVDPATATRHALEEIARHLSRVPGRKTLVWITSGFPLFLPGLGIDFRYDMEKAARALNDANVALYAVDARGLIGSLSGTTAISNAESGRSQMPTGGGQVPLAGQPPAGLVVVRASGGFPSGTDTMAMLAGLTGGLVFINDNGIEDLIQTAADDGDLMYTLGFYPLPGNQDGTWHNLKVQVARRGVKVQYRENYFAARDVDMSIDQPTLEQLLRDPLDATQVELVAEPALDPERPGFLRIKVTVDLHGLSLQHENARLLGGIDVSFYIEGSEKVLTKTIKIDIPDDQFGRSLEKGIETTESIQGIREGGALRIVVMDRTTSAGGSVTLPLGLK